MLVVKREYMYLVFGQAVPELPPFYAALVIEMTSVYPRHIHTVFLGMAFFAWKDPYSSWSLWIFRIRGVYIFWLTPLCVNPILFHQKHDFFAAPILDMRDPKSGLSEHRYLYGNIVRLYEKLLLVALCLWQHLPWHDGR